jgi:hypothetical protein
VPADSPTKPPRQRLPLNAALPRPPKLPAEYATEAGEARPGAGGAEETPTKSRRAGIKLEIGSLAELGKFILLLAGLGLGVWNRADRAPDSDVEKHEVKISAQQTRLEGPASEGGLAERVTKLERTVAPLVAYPCQEQLWLQQVLAKADPPILIRPENCPRAPAPISVTVEPAMPGKRGRGATVVHSPYPMPRAE